MQRERVHVILLEARPERSAVIQRQLVAAGHAVSAVDSTAALIAELSIRRPAIAVLDILDDSAAAVAALCSIPEFTNSLALILITASKPADTRMRLLELRFGQAAVVGHDLVSLTAAVEKCDLRLLSQRGLLKVGNTFLDPAELLLSTSTGDSSLQPATCNILAALMRAHPHPVKHQDLLTDVVRFAPDTRSQAVYSRIYGLRSVLEAAGADIDVGRKDAAGYGICMRSPAGFAADTERAKARQARKPRKGKLNN